MYCFMIDRVSGFFLTALIAWVTGVKRGGGGGGEK